MAGWFARLTGRKAPTPAATAASNKPVAALPVAPALPTGPAQPPAPSPSSSFGLHRPLVGKQGQIAGFELLLPPLIEERLHQRGDGAATASARAAHQAMLLAAAAPLAKAGRVALLTVSAQTLSRPGVAAAAPAGAMVCVQSLPDLTPELSTQLRARGLRLGVPDGPPQLAPPADFVLLQAGAAGLDTVLLSAQHWREARPQLPQLVTGLAHLDDVERLLRSGFALVGGLLGRSLTTPAPRPLNATAHRICELMNHLALDRDTHTVADAVRADVALSYRLLRYANSAAVGASRSVDTVDAAVLLLGRQELHRWLSVMLLTAAESRQASQALQEAALARGRLFESLADLSGEPAAATLFTVGVLSMLDVLLQTPLAEVLAPLRLPEASRLALLQRQGPHAHYLAVADALDAADGQRLQQLCTNWGGVEVVQDHASAAWGANTSSAPANAPVNSPVNSPINATAN
jgi:c-di-GMP phosphodiesterase